MIRCVWLAVAGVIGIGGVSAAGEPNADALTFREIHLSGLIPGSMFNPFSATVSPDGRDVYVSTTAFSGILHFRRNTNSGVLTFAESVEAQLNPTGPLFGAYQLVASPDGRFVFAAIADPGTRGGIARFDRNSSDGSLSLSQGLPDDASAMEGLHSPVYLSISPDGRHLYVLNDQYLLSPYYPPSISVVAIDQTSGAMTFVQRIDRPVAGAGGYDSFAEVTVSPDGENVYVAGYSLGYVERYDRDTSTGMLTSGGIADARGLTVSFVNSVAVSPDGNHAYATDSTNGAISIFDRVSSGDFVARPADAVNLPGASRITMAPDGTRVYVTSLGDSFSSLRTRVNAYARNRSTGRLTLIESLVDGVGGFDVLEGPALAAISPDGESYYLPSFQSHTLAVFSRTRPGLPCEDMTTIGTEYEALVDAYSLSDDINGDALPDLAALALLEEASCGGVADGFDEAITNAYLINLATIGTETEVYSTGVWEDYQHALSTLLLMSESMRMYLNSVFAATSTSLQPLYVVVDCVGDTCEPANARDAWTRSATEPLSGEGDPDGDGFTNAEEWANVVLRGGSAREFGVSALDPTNDGSREVSFGGGGSSSCFIATAAYGTPLAAELDALRAFRDARLLTNAAGSAFADAYYRLSPAAAQWIAVRPSFKELTRNSLEVTWRAPWKVFFAVTVFAAIAILIRRSRLQRN